MINDQKVLSSQYPTDWQKDRFMTLSIVERINWDKMGERRLLPKKIHCFHHEQMPFHFLCYPLQFQNTLIFV